MKTKPAVAPALLLLTLLAPCLSHHAQAATQIYDLKTDWSDASNPNGVWTYRAGSVVMGYSGGGNAAGAPGWVGSDDYLPVWFKSTWADHSDIHTGDVIVHSANNDSEGVAWAALSTMVTGLLLATMNKYIGALFTFQPPFTAIAIGMWLGLFMGINVWAIIWPNQKKALGIVTVEPAEKARAARVAMLASRLNTLLSIPMLYCMVAQQNGGL